MPVPLNHSPQNAFAPERVRVEPTRSADSAFDLHQARVILQRVIHAHARRSHEGVEVGARVGGVPGSAVA
jgi:hypothetical protein